MRSLLLAALLCCPCLLLSRAGGGTSAQEPAEPSATAEHRPEPFWEVSLGQARGMASWFGKSLLVAFYGPDCPACETLDATTFADERVLSWLDERAFALRLRQVSERDQTEWRVLERPTLLFLSSQGDELGRLTGAVAPEAFLAAADGILDGTDGLERARARVEARPEDPWARLLLARALKTRRHTDEQIAQLAIFMDATRGDPAWRTWREGEVLFELGGLAFVHPAATAVLVERRDAQLAVLMEPPRADEPAVDQARLAQAAREVRLMNLHLDQARKTLATWDALRERGDCPAAVLDGLFGWEVLTLLRQSRRYADMLAAVPDPVVAIEGRLAEVLGSPAEADQPSAQDGVRDADLNRVVSDAATFYEALLAVGREQEAADVAELLFVVDPRPITFTSFIRGAKRVERLDLARAHLERGLEAVATDAEREQLRRFGQTALGG